MCGIVGFWNRDGRVASEVLIERMLEQINHRGPDDKGTWAQGAIGLGHARLSILDLSERGRQPFVTADGSGVISYNGEVYNYRELRKKLEQEGIRFKSSTDTEAVLYALHCWGPERAATLFDGMFAFSYYDRRSGILWLARDRMGIKPLYVAEVDQVVAFSSEIKALLRHPSVPCRADLHALTTQVIHQRLTGNWTPFDRIRSVVPGTLERITESETTEITYFDVLQDVEVERIVGSERSDFDDLVADFEYQLSSSVRAHLVSDVPLASMCSGGLDSSLMTAVAKEHKPDIVAYVADVEGLRVSEADKAERVSRHVGIELSRVKVNQEKFLRLWPLSVFHNDVPNFFAQNVLTMAVSVAAAQDGFKVLLSGEGSDELFGGYPWHVDAYRMWRVRGLHLAFVPNLRFLKNLGDHLGKLAPLHFADLVKRPFKHRSDEWPDAASGGQVCAVDGAQRLVRESALFVKLQKIRRLEDRAFLARSFEDFYVQLRTALSSNDKMAMAASVEGRVPFLGNALVDFGLHLPRRAKYDKGITKRIVKAAAERRLPLDIVHAPKIGYGITQELWRGVSSFLDSGMVGTFLKWRKNEMETIYRNVFNTPHLLFRLLSIELWARIYFRGESPTDLGERLVKISRDGNALPKSQECLHG